MHRISNQQCTMNITNTYFVPLSTSILSNPEILRQLQNLQQMQQEEEKRRKLEEMKQQEEEFDKHLAQTVPVSERLVCLVLMSLCFSKGLIVFAETSVRRRLRAGSPRLEAAAAGERRVRPDEARVHVPGAGHVSTAARLRARQAGPQPSRRRRAGRQRSGVHPRRYFAFVSRRGYTF